MPKPDPKSSPSFSDRLRMVSCELASRAFADYTNGNRKDARERLRSVARGENGADLTILSVAGFLDLARDSDVDENANGAKFLDAVRFLDSFADF